MLFILYNISYWWAALLDAMKVLFGNQLKGLGKFLGDTDTLDNQCFIVESIFNLSGENLKGAHHSGRTPLETDPAWQ